MNTLLKAFYIHSFHIFQLFDGVDIVDIESIDLIRSLCNRLLISISFEDLLSMDFQIILNDHIMIHNNKLIECLRNN